jgi:tetrapyrrole methylase family protein / MazG family protein
LFVLLERKKMPKDEKQAFGRLMDIMRRLRAPGGCPWDAEQTHESLKRYLIEECYEVIEAIDAGDDGLLKEELGDLILQPVFHAAVAEERNAFTMEEVLETVCEKLVRRHPHVFGEEVIETSEAQVANWEKIKKGEKGEQRPSALSGIPPHIPSLLRAQKVTEKAARAGFEWENADQAHAKAVEELRELEEAIRDGKKERIEEEMGDLLFALVNLGRFHGVTAEDALGKALRRFDLRFRHVEERLREKGEKMEELPVGELLRLWREAKQG